ncbi:MAG: glutamate mutase L [Burkholderiaceae bacterium]|nr:glutamate mutase L [Burkholderiaceae bacterium]
MPVTLAVDFGSTYTKVAAIDCDDERLVGRAQSPTTVAEGVMVGLGRALALLEATCGVKRDDIGQRLASSSAAGGLRMVAIGLVPDLTAEAARRAALGAGAKVQRVFAYELSGGDVDEIVRLAPDLILLCGGTDGGERKTIVRNAGVLAAARVGAPVVVAGNRSAADEVKAVLQDAGVDCVVVGNVLPELDRLDVEPARAAIRSVFMERIAHAKGLDQAEAYVGRIVMPTPMAVLEGARLLAAEGGMGDAVIVDVGGATTDIHSIASGLPSTPGLVPRGLPEPFAKRTVEGDLGLRINAPTIVEAAGAARVAALAGLGWTAQAVADHVQRLAQAVDHVPGTAAEHALDAALAQLAVDVALERHAGQVTTSYTPMGAVQLLHGKDLGAVSTVVGTGGVLVHGRHPRRVLEAACYSAGSPTSLRPRAPALLIDRSYLLFAAGLLAPIAPLAVARLLRRHLVAAEEAPHDT